MSSAQPSKGTAQIAPPLSQISSSPLSSSSSSPFSAAKQNQIPAAAMLAKQSPPSLNAQHAAYAFTIPSLHDDAPLACRIFHPRGFLDEKGDDEQAQGQEHRRETAEERRAKRKSKRKWRAAIIAHPYAPLGGSYDDPVVGHVGGELVAAGWVVGVFCFRGAHTQDHQHHHHRHHHGQESPSSRTARTSWTGKPEVKDYMAFVGLMVEYIRCLQRDSHISPPTNQNASSPPPPREVATAAEERGGNDDEKYGEEGKDDHAAAPIHLILAGYSYGSLIASRLPPLSAMLASFYGKANSSSASPPPGSTASEILLRAQHLASDTVAAALRERQRSNDGAGGPRNQQQQQLLLLQLQRGPVTFGGEESDPDARRRSREAARRNRRSFEAARSGTEKLRKMVVGDVGWGRGHHHRSGTRSPGSAVEEEAEEGEEEVNDVREGDEGRAKGGAVTVPRCEVAFLLISPLLPPTSLVIAPGLTAVPPGLSALPGLGFAVGWFAGGGGGRTQQQQQHAATTGAASSGSVATPEVGIVDPLLKHPTLAVWGENDSFTSGKRLKRWVKAMQENAVAGELGFRGVEVEGASHFWQERGVMARLRAEVRDWTGKIGRGGMENSEI